MTNGCTMSSPGVDPSCPRCRTTNKEDVIHAPWDCPISREALILCNIHNDLFCLSFCNAIDWLEATMRKMDKRAFTSFLMLLWQLWEARNLFVIQGQVSSLQDVVLRARSIHHEFRVHNLFYAPLLL
ncbi:hypothetical protein V6Z11_D10G120200 [Gossypium hirsutum]